MTRPDSHIKQGGRYDELPKKIVDAELMLSDENYGTENPVESDTAVVCAPASPILGADRTRGENWKIHGCNAERTTVFRLRSLMWYAKLLETARRQGGLVPENQDGA